MSPIPEASTGEPLDKTLSDTTQEQIRALENAGTVRPLTSLQVAAIHFLWPILIVILLCFLFIAGVWYAKLPAVPPYTSTPEQIAVYREEMGIANDAVKDVCETVFTKGLYPILMLGIGILLGRKANTSESDNE